MTQNELNKQGASDLVVELFMSESPVNILEESVNLAIALLEGGNTEVQVSASRVHRWCTLTLPLVSLDQHLSTSAWL